MPIFVYECKKCNQQWERIELSSSDKPQKCPKCRGKAERIPAVSNFTLKGSGFHKNDYPKGS